MGAEEVLLPRRSIGLFVLLGLVACGWLKWRERSTSQQPRDKYAVHIDKRPIAFTQSTFDPAAPPADMPSLQSWETAECESNFLSTARVGGQAQRSDATHAIVTITKVEATLLLKIVIWVPKDATQHVVEHEQGHRQISESYYRDADKLAERIAATYLGKQVPINGENLDREFSKLLEQMGTQFTEEYNKALNPGPTQLLYDTITDHSRNEVSADDAVAQALNDSTVATTQPVTNPE